MFIRHNIPQISAFFFPLLVLSNSISSNIRILTIFISQGYFIISVIHSCFIPNIHDAVEMLSLLVLSSFLDNPSIPRIFFLLLFLLVLVYDAVTIIVPGYYMFLFLMMAKDTVLIIINLFQLPNLTWITLSGQSHSTLTYYYLSFPPMQVLILLAETIIYLPFSSRHNSYTYANYGCTIQHSGCYNLNYLRAF